MSDWPFSDARQIELWRAAGFAPEEACRWWRAGCSLEMAVRGRAKGYTPQQTVSVCNSPGAAGFWRG